VITIRPPVITLRPTTTTIRLPLITLRPTTTAPVPRFGVAGVAARPAAAPPCDGVTSVGTNHLPPTGASPVALAVVAGLLVLSGATLVGVRRRRS
jgi:LPXTG-motif cell wall-anchored protein